MSKPKTKSQADAKRVAENSTKSDPFPHIPTDVNVYQDRAGRSQPDKRK